jgi:hypothetical protein
MYLSNFLIILIIISILLIVIFMIYYYNLINIPYVPEIDDSPIITSVDKSTGDIDGILHSRCKNSTCSGNLICDNITNRCKKQIGGDCSSNVDCQGDLICQNWVCTKNISPKSYTLNPKHKRKSSKKVHWGTNIIYNICKRK